MCICKYLRYRRCLLKNKYTSDPFATPGFCIEECSNSNQKLQKKMLLDGYSVKVDRLPTPESLHDEYGKTEKLSTTKSITKPTRTKDNQAYLINYCGQVCKQLHDKPPKCGVTKCKIKGSFMCPDGKWDSIDKEITEIKDANSNKE